MEEEEVLLCFAKTESETDKMGSTEIRLSVLFLLFGVGHVLCDISVKAGGKLTIEPKVIGNHIESILWKYKSNKLVEYEAGDETWYRFKDHGTLDKKTGHLTLQGLTKDKGGLYEAEIQVAGKLQNFRYDVKVIDPVSKPAVTCNANSSDEATLLCSVDRGDQAVFEWSGPNEFRRSGARLDVSKEKGHDALFICTAKNDVSQNTTEFAFNNCFPDDSNAAVIGGTIGGILGFLALGGIGIILYKKMRTKETGKYETVAMEDGAHDQESGNLNRVPGDTIPDKDECASQNDTVLKKQDSTGEVLSVQSENEEKKDQQENEEKKDQQDNTAEIANSTSVLPAEDEDNALSNMDDEDESVEKHDGGSQNNSEERPESIGGTESSSSVPTVLDQSRQDEDDSSSNMAKAEVPPSEDEGKPESTRENAEDSLVVPNEETPAKDEDNSSSNIGKSVEKQSAAAEVPPSNDEGKPKSTRENDEDSSVVSTEETPAKDEDNLSSNTGDEDKSVEKQSAAGDGQTVTAPPFKQPPTGNSHTNAVTPAPGTVEKRIEVYESFAQKPKILCARDADQEN